MSDAAPIEHLIGLTGGDFTEADEPVRLFASWFAEAKRAEPVNPDAMALATVGPDGMPNARMVLMKGFDERGFVFYTNVDSIKGHELEGAPRAALTFYWKSLQRQVRSRGTVEPVSKEEADAMGMRPISGRKNVIYRTTASPMPWGEMAIGSVLYKVPENRF